MIVVIEGIDCSSPVPMYYQLKELLRKEFGTEQYPPGSMIPSEIEMMKRFNVSRSTVRRAFDELERMGLLIRRQGKGTFIAESKLEGDLLGGYFAQQMSQSGLQVQIKVLGSDIKAAAGHEKRMFGLSVNDKVFHVIRLISVESEPVFIESWQIPEGVSPALLAKDLSLPFHQVLDKQYQLPPFRVVKYIEPALADRHESRILKIRPRQPVMLMERISYPEASDTAVLACKWIIRGDRCRHLIRSGF